MGTIGSALGSYYSLSGLLSSGSGSSVPASGIGTLAQALEASDSGSSQSGASAYLLDLSPQAQQLLSGSPSLTSSGSGASSQFVLSQTQQTAIENILAKYKNAPVDQATFDSIQNDLQAAGLSPQALGAEDQVTSFNPTNVLLEALSGNYSALQTPAASASTEQAKESSYMQSIVSLWKSEDSTSSLASGASSASGISSASGGTL